MTDQIPNVDPHSLKVVELKEELTKRGLETKGLKKDLIDRLQKAQDSSPGTSTELTSPSEDEKSQFVPSKQPAEDNAEAVAPDQQQGVGHSMVEGAHEAAGEIQQKVEEEVQIAEQEVPQPAVFDDATAEVIRREEVKEQLPLTPSPPQAISPLPPTGSASPLLMGKEEEKVKGDLKLVEVRTPPLTSVDLPSESSRTSTKRPREEHPIPSAKRYRSTLSHLTPLPSSLSRLIHPPTATLYITNLRRPLVHSTLHPYLAPSLHPADLLPAPRNPFASTEFPGLWLSGIKDHAYATYPSEEDAMEAAERIEGVKWPEDTGDKLHIEFIPDDRVRELVAQEEQAWSNGRQKLTLTIKKDEDGEVSFELKGTGAIGPRSGVGRSDRRPTPVMLPPGAPRIGSGGPGGKLAERGVILSGSNAMQFNARIPPPGAPSGPSGMGMGIRGRGGSQNGLQPRGRPFPVDRGRFGPRPEPGYAGRQAGPPNAVWSEGRLGAPLRTTRYRPSLTWREGPGATGQ